MLIAFEKILQKKLVEKETFDFRHTFAKAFGRVQKMQMQHQTQNAAANGKLKRSSKCKLKTDVSGN